MILFFHLWLLAQVASRLSVHLLVHLLIVLCFFVILIVHHAMHSKAIIIITITTITIASYSLDFFTVQRRFFPGCAFSSTTAAPVLASA